jgi:hypothetical protein
MYKQGCQMVSFQTKNSQIGCILEDLGIENVIIYSDHLEYFTTKGYILWVFSNFVVTYLVHFSLLWYTDFYFYLQAEIVEVVPGFLVNHSNECTCYNLRT